MKLSFCERVAAASASTRRRELSSHVIDVVCWLYAIPDNPHAIMGTIAAWIIFLELATPLSNFAARKLCHAGCGLGIMMLDSTYFGARLFVWRVAASSIAMTWNLSPLPPFRFSRAKDIGVTVYLLLVSVWFALQLPPPILAPLFFADPAGAVVGKALSRRLGPRLNPAWYDQNSTVFGSLAVFALTWLSISYECTALQRAGLAVAATVAEAVGGEYDNLAIGIVVLLGWLACGASTSDVGAGDHGAADAVGVRRLGRLACTQRAIQRAYRRIIG